MPVTGRRDRPGAAGNDPARVEVLRGEFDTLTVAAENERALGKRVRRIGTESTSVRTSVKNAIDLVVEKVRDHHPDLARHLELAIQTGAVLCYDPSPDVDWEA